MTIRKQITLLALAAFALPLLGACAGPGGGDIGNPMSRSDEAFAQGIGHLEKGEFEAARASFNEVLTLDDPEYTCEAQYGIVLAGVLDTADRLDTIADAAALLLGGAPSLMPAQSLNIVPIVQSLLVPFEEFFIEIVAALDLVVASGCKVMVPAGMPIEIGNPDSLIYFKARFGYEFDAAAARAGQILFSSALASLRMTLAHNIEINLDQLTESMNAIVDAARGSVELVVNEETGEVTQHTMIHAVRSLGSIPETQQNLLTLGDLDRFKQVDNDLVKAIRAFYFKDGDTETGLLAQLVAEAANDPDPTDNFLGYMDANSNGTVDASDSIIIGLRELHITGLFSEPEIGKGIWFNFSKGLGNIEKIIAAVHEMAQIVGDQLASVDDPNVATKNLGLKQINQLIDNITILDIFLTPLPEAVEFDIGAYFKNPIGVRSLFPYWVDHDNNSATRAEFWIEGENWVTSTVEPYVFFGDAAHFADTYTFLENDDADPIVLDDLEIPADGIEPEKLSILVPFPLPYVAYQDPTFNGVLYVDASKLYGAGSGETTGMNPANLYTANMATASYFSFVMNEWLYSN